MARSHPGEAQARAAIRAWLEAGEPQSRASLHREHAEVPQRTFYNWVEAERVRLDAEELPLPPPKSMPAVRQVLSRAFCNLSLVDDYESTWDDYHLLRRKCYAAPNGLNAPLMKRCVDVGLKVVHQGMRIHCEIIEHNDPDLVLEAMTPIYKAKGEEWARAHFLSLQDLLKRRQSRGPEGQEPACPRATNDADLIRPGLSDAFDELQVRDLFDLIWSDCLAIRARAAQTTGDASMALLELSTSCRIKAINVGLQLPAICEDQDRRASGWDKVVAHIVEAAPEHAASFYAELAKAREAYGEQTYT